MTAFITKTADSIKALRLEKGFTQEELAEKIFVSRQAVSRWENSETMPGVDSLKELSKVFGVTINRLLGDPVKLVCQCCGMELDENSVSCEPDGGANPDYCKWCYEGGEFAYKSLPELVEYLVTHVPLGEFTREQAEEFFSARLKELNYWKEAE
ncbi:MAG: helix-turn-helix domain-containing protein [Oscillospiraceae bacterium]|nr:helix-turn-helix domain-containing protein [Oscillospiraceae bacterium]